MKIRLSSIEILGFVGLFICILTNAIRNFEIIDNTQFNLFWFAPNFGGAWFTTALIKQLFNPVATDKSVFFIDFNIKHYSIICLSVIILSILNEFALPLNTSGSFDIIDIFATIIAQIIIFIVPIIIKDKCLSNFKNIA